MARLTPRDKRTIRLAAIGVALYLAVFYGARGFGHLETNRDLYLQMRQDARSLNVQLLRHEKKVLQLEKLRKSSRIDMSRLSRATLAAETSAAIQQAAQSSGVKLGPIRESPGSATARELAAMQLEGTGTVAAVMSLLHQLDTLGFPIVVESLQIDPDPGKPGHVKLILRAVLLDADQWKNEEGRRA